MSDVVTLAEACVKIVDCEHKTAPHAATGAEYGYLVGTPHIRSGRILLDAAKRVDQETYQSWTAREVPRGDDLILAREAPVGQVGRITSGQKICLGQRTVLLRPDVAKVDPRYLHYLLLSPAVQETMASKAAGSTVAHLNVKDIRELPLPSLPNRSYQMAVADLLAALDDKIAINGRISATADALSHALFSQQFDTPAGSYRSGWTPGLLSDICSTQYGYTATSTAASVGPRFLRVKDINKNNWITWPEVPYCEIDDRNLDKYRLSVGDLLVARMADPGKSAIVEEPTDAVFASYLVRLKTASLAHSYFVWGFLKSDVYRKYAESARSGSVQANMNAKVIVGAELLIPPTELMETYLGTVMPLRRRLTTALRESQSLATLRDTLLPQLMSGRIRVKEAEKIVEDNT
ncbi:restriction endonuclease subunit S [Streptomyces sp. NBC_01423]|uniref:restriction endonuclease subunit S n=1 Tax=Streptomyces sp. NBC_01423 TaxID=2903860 RepID=UPI002E2B886D|nr:restriction endonuclease subunit S [Streptomyces sp. NBC_01423]